MQPEILELTPEQANELSHTKYVLKLVGYREKWRKLPLRQYEVIGER